MTCSNSFLLDENYTGILFWKCTHNWIFKKLAHPDPWWIIQDFSRLLASFKVKHLLGNLKLLHFVPNCLRSATSENLKNIIMIIHWLMREFRWHTLMEFIIPFVFIYHRLNAVPRFGRPETDSFGTMAMNAREDY